MNERCEIDDVDARLSEVLAGLSHELRNPLNAILGWASVLARRSDLPEPVMLGLQAIERNSRLQARMIADLLDYAAISTGQVRLAIEAIDPYPVVRAAIQTAAAAASDAGVAVEASFGAEPLRVAADAARLEQLIGNLLSNAVKFSERGAAVQIAAQRSGTSFRLVVRDHGKGIDPEVLPRLFERIGRKGAPHSRGGLGIGLAMVKQLAELHSGTVQAESGGRSRGAAFILELPLCIAASPIGVFPKAR